MAITISSIGDEDETGLTGVGLGVCKPEMLGDEEGVVVKVGLGGCADVGEWLGEASNVWVGLTVREGCTVGVGRWASAGLIVGVGVEGVELLKISTRLL